MEKNIVLSFLFLPLSVLMMSSCSHSQDALPVKISVSSALVQQDFSIHSKILQETREIIVHLPENYDPENKEGYPVLYMLDAGRGNHDGGPTYDEIVVQIAREHFKVKIMPEVIVIGVKNIRRGYDLTPHFISRELDGKQMLGNGDKFLAFIENELIPFSGKKFRTNGRRVFMGHSMAGRFMAYSLSQSPELFDAYFITSQSVGSFGDQIYNDLKAVFKQDLDFPTFIYVSVGGDEKPGMITYYEGLTTLLEQHLPAQVKLFHEINAGKDHSSNEAISRSTALEMYFSITPVPR